MSIPTEKSLSPYETRIIHTKTSCGISIRSVSQKAKNEHGRNITLRFSEIKNPNSSNTDNLISLLEQIKTPTKEIKAFQVSNDINYPHPPQSTNNNPVLLKDNSSNHQILLGKNESPPEKCDKNQMNIKNNQNQNQNQNQKAEIAFPMKEVEKV
jgi:hypothetical protein